MSGIKDKDYLIMSDLSYLDFKQSDSEAYENIKEVLIKRENEILFEGNTENKQETGFKKMYDVAGEFFNPILEGWRVLDVQDNNDSSGFYGAAFINQNNEVVFAFRGTEV